jgi:hypothetical protein
MPLVVPVVAPFATKDTFRNGTRVAIRYLTALRWTAARASRLHPHHVVEMAGDESIPTLRQEYRFFKAIPGPDLSSGRQRAPARLSRSARSNKRHRGRALRHESTQTWDIAPSSTTQASRLLPVSSGENREHLPRGWQRIEAHRLRCARYVGRRVREFSVEGDPPAKLTAANNALHTSDEAAWLVKLPVRSELRDEVAFFAISIYYTTMALLPGPS